MAFGGDGDDHIYVKEGVTSDIEFHGGNGNDVFVHEGTGEAYLYGDAGDDYLTTSFDSNTAFMFGGDGIDYIIHNGTGRAEIDGGAGSDKIFGGMAADLIRGGSGDDDIDGRGGADEIYGGSGNDMILWTYNNVVINTVDGGSGDDILEIVGQKGADDFYINSLGSNRFKVANRSGGSVMGSVTGINVEDLRLDGRGGADSLTLDYMAGSGLKFVNLVAGKNVVENGIEIVNDPESGQPVEQPRVTISDDRAADTITVFGEDINSNTSNDLMTLADYNANDIVGISITHSGAGLNGSALVIVVSDSIRSEGDTLVISTRGGKDTVDAYAVATDRVALEIIGGEGDDTLSGSRFNDVIDSGMGSDTVRGDLGLDIFLDSSPSATNGVDDDGDGRIDEADENEVDTLIEDLSIRTETFSADVGLYNDTFVIGNLLNSSGSAPFETGKNATVEL